MAKSDGFRILSGDVYLAEYTGDVVGLEREVGHVNELAIEAPELTEIVEKGMGTGDWGDDIGTIITETSQTFSLISKSITQKNLAMALMGSEAAYTQSAGADAATDTPSNHDMWSKLDGYRLDQATPPVVTDPTAVTTYVEDDDYEIDYVAGMIKVLSTGSTPIPDAEVLKVTPTWLAITDGFKIAANAEQTKRYRLRLVIKDNYNEIRGELIIYKLKINSSGAIAFLNTELQQLELTGLMIKTTGHELFDLWNY